MKKDKMGKPKKLHSLRNQIALLFMGLILLSMLLITVINMAFLERYFISKKADVLMEAVSDLDSLETDSAEDEGVYGNTLEELPDIPDDIRKKSSRNNLSWIIISRDNQVIAHVGDNVDVLRNRLFGYAYELDMKKGEKRILEETDQYVVQQVRDRFVGMDYVESWGILSDGNYFLIRSPLESIRKNVEISNKFYLYVCLSIIVISGVVIWILTKRITRPISELTLLSRKMSNLEFEARYESHAGNEIDTLGENFNSMSHQLERTISELKSANNKLEKDIADKIKIDQMRKEFLDNVSHELKTPIALIQGYAEGLKENINDDPENQEFYCDVIMDEAAKMNKLVKNLLTLNQLESGKDEMVMERFDIVSLIRGVLQSMDIMIQQKDAKVIFDGSESVYVWADEFKIEEVVTNYVNNALNHLAGTRQIEIRLYQERECVRVTVFNTGQPIPEEDIPNLWNKFYKVDKARTREYGGSGIGLSIVKAVMDGLHQQYGVRNYDNGVEFWFTLDRNNHVEQ